MKKKYLQKFVVLISSFERPARHLCATCFVFKGIVRYFQEFIVQQAQVSVTQIRYSYGMVQLHAGPLRLGLKRQRIQETCIVAKKMLLLRSGARGRNCAPFPTLVEAVGEA